MKYKQFEYQIVNLGECEHIFTSSSFSKYYSKTIAEMWDVFINKSETNYDVTYYLNLLKKFNITNNARVLDIGCRTGSFAIQLSKKKYRVLAIDPCDNIISVFKKKKIINSALEIQLISIEDFETNERFSGIVSFHFVQYFIENDYIINFFKKVFRLLQKDGVFLFAIYNIFDLWNTSGWEYSFDRKIKNGCIRCEHKFEPINVSKRIVKASDYRYINSSNNCTHDNYSKLVRLYTLDEYKEMLMQVGFNNITVNIDQCFDNSEKINNGHTFYVSAIK